MHWDKSPKDKPCYTLPTVKKLLEQKRKRETSSLSPSVSCSTTRASPVPLTAVPQGSTSAPPSSSAGASSSYSDMAVSFQQWPSAADSPGPFSYYPSPPCVSYAASYSPLMVPGYNPPQAIQGYGDQNMSQAYEGQGKAVSQTSFWPSPSATNTTSVSLDASKLEEAKRFLSEMDYNTTASQDEDGDTILHIYTAKGLRECAFAAAEKLRDLGQLDVKEHKGKTALLVAVTANQPDIAHDLLSLGADINACDVNGQTSLHLAASYGFLGVLQVILSTGFAVNLEVCNFEGMTPLHCAAVAHCSSVKHLANAALGDGALQTLRCLQMLLKAGASLLSQEIKSNKTLLHLAVKEGNIELFRYLLSIPLPNMKDFVNMKAHGHTALHMAAGLHGNPHQREILQLLLNSGADPSIRNLENDQPAHLLQSGPYGEQLKLILKRRSASARRK